MFCAVKRAEKVLPRCGGDCPECNGSGVARCLLEIDLGYDSISKCAGVTQDAHRLLRENRVDQAPVVDADQRPVGLVDVQDLLDIEI